jgi:hypothetical protein
MRIHFAESCAWRAMYVRIGDRQVFHLGVDPNDGVKPKLFGGFAFGSWDSWLKPYGFNFTLPLPWARWTGSSNPIRLFLCRLSSRFWHAVDGRY